MKTEIRSTREAQETSMGKAKYHHRTFPGENPYYNINLKAIRIEGIMFYQNIITESPLSERAIFKPCRILGNAPDFVQRVVNW